MFPRRSSSLNDIDIEIDIDRVFVIKFVGVCQI